MIAVIPHKDMLNTLNKISKSFINEANKSFSEVSGMIFPIFPLWAFTKDFQNDAKEFSIESPGFENREIFFPLKIAHSDFTETLRIVFARASKDLTKDFSLPLFSSEIFPLRARVFRTGTVEFSNNSWNLFDEKWHRIKNS
ncbi:MAG: hypothetical protein J5930_06385 [Treponema sp.]|nr:hypothetical protein [Treponema sp.]MBO5607508.1 hypothetical protein [Treponema sp.]